MRWGYYALAGVLALLLNQGAKAQQTGDFKSGLTGVNPTQITFKQVDVQSLASSGTSTLSSFRAPSALSNFIHSFSPFSGTTRQGFSNIPQPMYQDAFRPVQPTTMTIQR